MEPAGPSGSPAPPLPCRGRTWLGLAAATPLLLTAAALWAARPPVAPPPAGGAGGADRGPAAVAPGRALAEPADPGEYRQARAPWAARRPVPRVRGAYVPPGVLASPARLAALVDLVERTELDALVIDVKSDDGTLTHPSGLADAAALGAVRPRVPDLAEVVRRLHARGIYAIARVVAFKDPVAAARRPAWAIQAPGRRPWRDREGMTWLNPYHPEARGHVLAVAQEAARLGFDEVQFDYVRFPSDGPVRAAVYPVRDGRPPARVIGDFLREARALLPRRVHVSADVFGQVPSVRGDMGIGQAWEEVAAGIDVVSPMVYPSHYRRGVYGLADPDGAPYHTVRRALDDARRRLPVGSDAVIRPWLQDFSLRHRYGPAEVRAQIRAVYDAGLDQWLLWNPVGRYTAAALAPRDPAP